MSQTNFAVRLATAAVTPEKTRSSLHVRTLARGEEALWDQFVSASPSGTLCHLTAWSRVVEKTLGHTTHALAAWRGNDICGVLPISHVRNPIFGDCLVSMPLAVYGGVCADDADTAKALLDAGAELGGRLRVKYLELRNAEEPFPSNLPGRELYVTFVQDLSPGPEKLLQSLPRDTRYMIRKSLKAGLEWCEDATLDEFYELYAGSVHRLGTPVFSRSLFTYLSEEFRGQTRLFGVRKNGKVVASVLSFYFRDRVMPYYAGSLPEYNRDGVNNFMYWKLMEQSCQEGIRIFDFGRSKKGTGAFQFKSSWGMAVRDLPYKYQLHTAKEVPHLSPVDPKFQAPVAAWKRLPYPLTKVLGPVVLRWIPSV
jgi:FemAB-related protein (PEP-CTERM system-associated)